MHSFSGTPQASKIDLGVLGLFNQWRSGHTLPQDLYLSEAVFDFEMKAVFSRSWLQAGLLAEIPRVGDFITVQLGKTSVIITRASESSVKAYLNSCRHRGSKICHEHKGSSNRLVCPYHQWTYDLQGNLLFARNMQEDFDKSSHGLIPVHCETVAGVIFIALSDDAPDFAPFSAALEPMLAPHRLEDAKIAHSCVLSETANWKLVMENARECYHCSARHPELLAAFRDPTVEDYFSGKPSWMAEFESRCAELGLQVGPVEGDWYDMMRFPLAEGVDSLTLDGKPASRRPLVTCGEGSIGSFRWATEPNAFSHAMRDYAFTFEMWPVNVGLTNVHAKWLVHKDAVEGVDYDLTHLTTLWNATNDQDRWLAENNQSGVEGDGYIPGPYSAKDEQKVIDFVNWYCATARAYLDREAKA